MTTQTATPATERQITFIESLLSSKAVSDADREGIEQHIAMNAFTTRTASITIEYLKGLPRRAVAVVTAELSVGMYRKGGEIYRIHQSRETGKLYAKVLIWDIEEMDRPRFEYARGAIMRLTSKDRMTLDEAKAWGVETGVCCVCGTFLTDPKSVSAGIGPVCGRRV